MSYVYPAEIQGWMSEDQCARLYELAAGRVVLEMGTFCGKSTVAMAQSALHVHAVDWHDNLRLWHKETLPACWANIGRYELRERVTLHVGPTYRVLPLLPASYFDFILHDAGHEYREVRDDLILCRRLWAPGTLLAIHDMPSRKYPGVAEAVHELFSKTLETVDFLPGENTAGGLTIVSSDDWMGP